MLLCMVLDGHGALSQHIFLMEAGETMTHFCAEVFAAVRPPCGGACMHVAVVAHSYSSSLPFISRQYLSLCVQIQKGDVWCNSSFLNALLLDALQLRLQGLEEL